jgi:hypothetical protein
MGGGPGSSGNTREATALWLERVPIDHPSRWLAEVLAEACDARGYIDLFSWLDPHLGAACRRAPDEIQRAFYLLADSGLVDGWPYQDPASGDYATDALGVSLVGDFPAPFSPAIRRGVASKPTRQKIKAKVVLAIMRRDGFAYRRCGVAGGDLTIDHVTPVVRGGTNDDENLQTLCGSCNRTKGAR